MNTMFTISDEKLAQVAKLYSDRTGDPAEATMADIRGAMLDYDWHNADEHQDWLNTAPADEIASWLASVIYDENGDGR